MRRLSLGVGIALLIGLCAIVAQAAPKEVETSIDKVPAKVKATILKQSRGAKIQKIEVVSDNGEEVIEVEMLKGDKTIEFMVAPDGKYLGVKVDDEESTAKVAKGAKGEKEAKAAKDEDEEDDADDAKPVKKAAKVAKGVKAEKKEAKTAKDEDEEDDAEDAKPAKKASAKLSAAAAKTFKKVFPKAKIEKLDVDVENGVTVYDIEFNNGPVERETDIAADGTMLEITLVIDEQELPKAVLKAFKKGTHGAEFGRIERITIRYETKDGKVVMLPKPVTHYSVEYAKGNQTAEITVNPDGSAAPE